MKKKSLALIMAIVMVFGVTVGTTLAYLLDTTDTIANTFTVGAVDITLEETFNAKSDNSASENDVWVAQVVPGTEYVKDPVVTVEDTTNVDCYLFVKFEEVGSPADYFTYDSTLDDGEWTLVDGETNVWYREVGKDDATKSWHLLANDKIAVKTDVEEADMKEAAAAELVYTAFAVQKDNLTVDKAWAEVKP